MNTTIEEKQFIIAQILLIDPTSEQPRIHPKRRNPKKMQLVKRLEKIVEDFEEERIEIDLEPYLETIEFLKKLKPKDFELFIQEK